jgi:hypothetical protein
VGEIWRCKVPRKKKNPLGGLPMLAKDAQTKITSITHGAYSSRRQYWSGSLDLRCVMSAWAREQENEYAQHVGYERFDLAPITVRTKVKVLIGNLIFIAMADPPPENRNLTDDVKHAQVMVNRICSELGLKPAKKEVSIHDILAGETNEAN